METYNIKDVNLLETSSEAISSGSKKIAATVDSLETLSNSVKSNWENDLGADVKSYLNKLQECVKLLEEVLMPTLEEYAVVLSELAEATKEAQSKTVEDSTSKGSNYQGISNINIDGNIDNIY